MTQIIVTPDSINDKVTKTALDKFIVSRYGTFTFNINQSFVNDQKQLTQEFETTDDMWTGVPEDEYYWHLTIPDEYLEPVEYAVNEASFLKQANININLYQSKLTFGIDYALSKIYGSNPVCCPSGGIDFDIIEEAYGTTRPPKMVFTPTFMIPMASPRITSSDSNRFYSNVENSAGLHLISTLNVTTKTNYKFIHIHDFKVMPNGVRHPYFSATYKSPTGTITYS